LVTEALYIYNTFKILKESFGLLQKNWNDSLYDFTNL